MAGRDKVLRLIFEVVDEINEVLPGEDRILGSEYTPIFSTSAADAGFDSLSRLHLILGVEGKLSETAGTAPNLSEILISDRTDRPTTLGALASFIAECDAWGSE